MKQQHNIIIRMSAAEWSASVRHNGEFIKFDFRRMDRKERSTFHRELMNAVRANRKAA